CALTSPGMTTRPPQSTVSRPVYVDDASGPTARIVSPTMATPPDRCSVNRSSIVSTRALVRRRSQLCKVTFADRSIVRHAASGSGLQAREYTVAERRRTRRNHRARRYSTENLKPKVQIQAYFQVFSFNFSLQAAFFSSLLGSTAASVTRTRFQARIDRHSIDLETSNAICPADPGAGACRAVHRIRHLVGH